MKRKYIDKDESNLKKKPKISKKRSFLFCDNINPLKKFKKDDDEEEKKMMNSKFINELF